MNDPRAKFDDERERARKPRLLPDAISEPAASTAHSAAVARWSNANGIAIVVKITSARSARARSGIPGPRAAARQI